jgi:hypothetical protein
MGRKPRRTDEGDIIGPGDWDLETFAGNAVEGALRSLWHLAGQVNREKGRTPSEKLVNHVIKSGARTAKRFYNADEKEQRQMIVDVTIDIEEQILLARATEGLTAPKKIGIEWGRGIKAQGMPWEDYLASRLPAGDRLPAGFKTFDFYSEETGLATSAKTLETTSPAKIAAPRQVYNAIKRHVDAAANFTSYELSGVSLTSDAITARELQLAVPPGTTPAQWVEIAKAIKYGDSVGVRVVVTPAQ